MSGVMIVDINTICRFCMEARGALSSIFDGAEEPSLVEQISSFSDIIVEQNEYLSPNICHRCRTKIEQCFEFKGLLLHSQNIISDGVHVMTANKDQCSAGDKVESQASNSYYVLPLSIENEQPLPENDTTYQDMENHNANIENDDMSHETERKEKFTIAIEKFKEDDVHHVNSRYTRNKCSNKMESENKQISETEIIQYPSVFAASKENQCLLCLEKLNDEDSLHIHIDRHIEGTDLDPYYSLRDKDIYCKLCKKTFEHRFTFLNDQREHLGCKPFVCQYDNCGASFYSNSALRHHLPIHADRKFICATCGVRFKRKSDLKSHEIIHEDAHVVFNCGLCGLLCKNRLTYAAHVRKHQKPPRFKCNSCHKEYFSRSELSRHLNVHSAEKKFKCDMCKSAYYSNSALNRHKKQHSKDDTADQTMVGDSRHSVKCYGGKQVIKTLYNNHISD